MMAPFFDELSKKYTNLRFVKVDVDELDDVASEIGISAMPSFFVFKDGKVVDSMVGASKEKLEGLCKKFN
jgi:thioredoxin 1